MVLKSSRLRATCQFWTERSLLGTVCTIDLKIGKSDVRVVSMYVPPFGNIGDAMLGKRGEEPAGTGQETLYTGKLAERVQQFTDQHRNGIGAADYIFTTARRRIESHLKVPEGIVICVGDFNANSGKQQHQSINGNIGEWTRRCTLVNSVESLQGGTQCPNTFYRGSEEVSAIDHVLHSGDTGVRATGYRVLNGLMWQSMSDHRPLVVDMAIAGMMETYVPRRKR